MGIKYAFKLLELNKITATKFKSTLKMILAIWNSLIKGGLLVTKKNDMAAVLFSWVYLLSDKWYFFMVDAIVFYSSGRMGIVSKENTVDIYSLNGRVTKLKY